MKKLKILLGEYEPEEFLLNPGKPIAVGPYSVTTMQWKLRKKSRNRIGKCKDVILEVAKEFKKISGREYGLFEEYKTKADYIMLLIGSAAEQQNRQWMNCVSKR